MGRLSNQIIPILTTLSQTISTTASSGITYSRGDRNAYLTARGYENDDASSLDPQSYKLLRKQLTQQSDQQQPHYNDKCTIYLAESSIPSSGLGLYTSTPLSKSILPHNQIGLLLQDPDYHNPHRDTSILKFDLLKNYVWSATPLTFGEHEVAQGESVCSGIGLMANCHYGLNNVDIYSEWKNEAIDGTDTKSLEGGKHSTLDDVGRGSFSWHGNVRYHVLRDIQAGEELFLSYGPQWYEHAEKEFGGSIPSKEQYEEADERLKNFYNKYGRDGEKYEMMLKRIPDKRLKAAFPKRVEDVPKAIELGTARFSVPNSIRSVEWLEENGVCLDNIVGGASTIPQVGQGAFAAKSMGKGDVIITTPVITLDREALKLFEEVKKDGKTKRRHVGYQLILNYSYGHKDSSMLFFPTAQGVSFINHGSKQQANAEVRWSQFPYHKSEWLDSTLAEMKRKEKSGLMFDIVATKDIARGDEILLYYGETWEKKWTQHINKWESSSNNFTDIRGIETTVDFNQIEKDEIHKTVDELWYDPLPENIMTRCGFALPGDMANAQGYSAKDPKYVPCEILEVEPFEGTDRYIYKAKVEHTPPGSNEATLYSVKYDSGQRFLRYVDKPYSKDYYRKGAFRQWIGLGEGVVPSHWLDLRKKDGS